MLRASIVRSSLLCALLCACTGEPTDFNAQWDKTTSRVITPVTETPRVDDDETIMHRRPHLMDAHGRYVHIRGLNVSGSHKAPPTEAHLEVIMPPEGTPAGERHRPSRYPLLEPDRAECLQVQYTGEGIVPMADGCLEEGPDGRPCTETDTCTIDYVNSPFPLDESDRWFGQMASLGFNSVRLITNWESIQPYQPGSQKCRDDDRYTDECYDLEYLDYYESLIVAAKRHGIYVLVDMHQDIFSRHIMTMYNESPSYQEAGETKEPLPGTFDHLVLSLFPPYTDWVRGHGAPRWVVQTALREKKMGSPYWGMFRGIGHLTRRDGTFNLGILTNLQALLNRFDPGGAVPIWLSDIINSRPQERFEVNETSDILPLSPWIVPGLLSLDVDRSFAALFAGDVAFPDLVVDDDGVTKPASEAENPDAPNLKEYLQTQYTNAFLQLAQRAKQYDNVIGYDLINEPVGIFVMMALGGLFKNLVGTPPECDAPLNCLFPETCPPGTDAAECVSPDLIEEGETAEEALARLEMAAAQQYECIDEKGLDLASGAAGAIRWCRSLGEQPASLNPLVAEGERFEEAIIGLLGEEFGAEIFALVRGLQLLPSDGHPYTMYQWGLSDVDAGVALGMNFGFEESYLQPFYERVGRAIQDEDPNAIIWFEPPTSLRMVTGASPFFDQPLTRPKGINQLVFAPHWYPDIYPKIGIHSKPRQFNSDEWLYRDFKDSLKKYMDEAPKWLGNIPTVFGEFGTYFNLRPSDAELDPVDSEELASHILNSYFEAFEALNLGHMLWCFSATNSAKYGEDWNHEDFSIIGPDGEPRAWAAYVRTYARATSGKLIRQRFISQFHFWDPEYGVPRPTGDYDLHMERRESEKATEVYVPRTQYPNGFYVWLSDGAAFFDDERQILYWYPTDDAPGVEHALHIEPREDIREVSGWSYFFHDGQVIQGSGAVHPNAEEVAQ